MTDAARPELPAEAAPRRGVRALWARSWKVLLALELLGLVAVGVAIVFFADSLGGLAWVELAALAAIAVVVAALALRRRRRAAREQASP